MSEEDAYVDRWIALGLSCEPMDVPAAIAAAQKCYVCAGLEPPKRYVVVDGPVSGALVAILLDPEFVPAKAGRLLDVIDDLMLASVARSLDLTPQVVEGRLRGVGVDAFLEREKHMMPAAHWANWSAQCDYLRNSTGLVEEMAEAMGHVEISKHCGWWAPYDTVAILQQKHSELAFDDAFQLHCTTGPAVRYRDGWDAYFWHGISVSRRIIMQPETMTLREIQKEDNVEVRRAMRGIYGEGRYLKEIGAQLIDADYEGARKGAAPRALLQDNEGQKFLVGTDGSTGRVYYMQVPPEVKTCREGHEALCGFDETRIIAKS